MLLYTLRSFVGNTFEQQIPFHGSKVLTFFFLGYKNRGGF